MHNVNASPDALSPVRAARLRAGLSMEQLAVKAGIRRATLYWAENAPHRVSERTARAVAAVLGVDPQDLRTAEHEMEAVQGRGGEGSVSFSKQDREATIEITFNLFGCSFTGNVGSVRGATGNAPIIAAEVLRTIDSLAHQAKHFGGHMDLDYDDRATSAPSPSRLREIMGSIASIAEQAAGNVVASGVLDMIPLLLARLGGA